jgi:hypothetical protein
MSINKVLNRPMFRQTALKKGHLKPAKLFLGGSSTQALPNPMFGPPRPNMMQRFNARPSVRFLKEAFSVPLTLGFKAGGKLADAFGMEKGFNVGRLGLETLGAYGAQRALPSLAVGAIGLPASLTGLGLIYGAQNRIKAGIEERKRINAMTPKERAEFSRVNRLKSTDIMSDGVSDRDIFGGFKPKEVLTNAEVKKTSESKAGPRGGRGPGFSDRLTQSDNESEVVKGTVDIDKVVKNNSVAPAPMDPPGETADKGFQNTVQFSEPKQSNEGGGDNTVATNEDSVEDTTAASDEKANKKVVEKTITDTENLDKPSKITGADGIQVNSEVIDLAKQYRKELMSGQKSQAKLVFLANLASGLLSGKTQTGGIGGALEVFGAALGPAVNNYATIKLKENELSNEFMSDALALAQDEIERRNAIIERPPVEGAPGMVQFTDTNGNLVNMTGIREKGGTVMVAKPGQLDNFGRNIYVPLAPGSYNRFVENKELDPKALEVLTELDQKYKALQYGRKSVALIQKFVEQGKTGAGPVGRLNLFKGRLSEALYDITGREMFTNEDEARAKANEYRELLIDDWLKSNEGFDRESAGKKIDSLLGDSVNSDKIMKAIGEFTGEADQQALSQLAINETVMVYALANSLKSKDRLTAKDIQMAKELVNIFPLLRGQKAVIRDLKSVNETILQDISSLENTYTTALMGETATLKNYKRKYGLITSDDFMGSAPQENPFKDLNTDQLLELYQ